MSIFSKNKAPEPPPYAPSGSTQIPGTDIWVKKPADQWAKQGVTVDSGNNVRVDKSGRK